MSLKFTLTETMRGSHHFVDPAFGEPVDRPCYFRIHWGGRLSDTMNPITQGFLRFEARGIILVDGLTEGEERCTGSLLLDYFRENRLVYELEFSVAGKSYRYVGEKQNVRLMHPLQLVKTHTTCYGTLTEEPGRIVSKSVIHFEPETLPGFMASFRLRRG